VVGKAISIKIRGFEVSITMKWKIAGLFKVYPLTNKIIIKLTYLIMSSITV